MTTFLPAEKGQTIRQPSTANFMVDSKDRPNPTLTNSNDFQITKNASLVNGFFTRIGLTELVLEWNQPNVSQTAKINNELIITAVGSSSGTTTTTFNPATGYYTGKAAIDFLLASLNTISATVTPATTWVLTNPSPGQVVLTPNNPIGIELDGNLATSLNINSAPTVVNYSNNAPLFVGLGVDLRPYRYLDFVSAQLTYNQDLKDTSTAVFNRDVLARWYMDFDQPNNVDAYGLPILMGYTPIYMRRLFNLPKQIRWDNIQPIGNVSFQVYDDRGSLAKAGPGCEFLMTLQLSEC